jgi:hypothetical protein
MPQNQAAHQEVCQCPLPDLDLAHPDSELARQVDYMQMKCHLFPSAKEKKNHVRTPRVKKEEWTLTQIYNQHLDME